MTGAKRYFITSSGREMGPFDHVELATLRDSGGIPGDAALVAEDDGRCLPLAAVLGSELAAAATESTGVPIRSSALEQHLPVERVDLYQRISENRTNSALLIALFVMLLTMLGLAGGLAMGAPILGAFGAMLIAALIAAVAYWTGDQAVLSISGARELAKADNPYLYNTVEGLSLAAGLPMPKVYVIASAAPNAFATGRDPAHASVAVTTGLLEKLDRLELEGVIAHEMAHIGNFDIRVALLVTALVGSVVLLADGMRNLFRFGFNLDNDDEGPGWARAAGLIVALVLALISPILAALLQAAVSRQREFLADAEGVRLTRYPEGLASALDKISRDTVPLHVANKATAHLFLVNPLLDHRGVVNSLFNAHPPAGERIRILRSM